MLKSILLSLSVLPFLGCSQGVDYGVISSKEYQPTRIYSSVQNTVVLVNGKSSVVTVPTTEVDDEDWVLYVYGETDKNEQNIDTWYVDQATFDAYKKGDSISFDPNTMSRFD